MNTRLWMGCGIGTSLLVACGSATKQDSVSIAADKPK